MAAVAVGGATICASALLLDNDKKRKIDPIN
jgi:hypothetical protein